MRFYCQQCDWLRHGGTKIFQCIRPVSRLLQFDKFAYPVRALVHPTSSMSNPRAAITAKSVLCLRDDFIHSSPCGAYSGQQARLMHILIFFLFGFFYHASAETWKDISQTVVLDHKIKLSGFELHCFFIDVPIICMRFSTFVQYTIPSSKGCLSACCLNSAK